MTQGRWGEPLGTAIAAAGLAAGVLGTDMWDQKRLSGVIACVLCQSGNSRGVGASGYVSRHL
jgi:hypothetical protein